MTDYALVEIGRQAVLSGRLATVRETLGLSLNAMAELLYVAPATYKSWELGTVVPRTVPAERLARFLSTVDTQLAILADHNINIADLVPMNLVASMAGVPHEVLLARYRAQHFTAEDLGLLGLWVHRDELDHVVSVVSR